MVFVAPVRGGHFYLSRDQACLKYELSTHSNRSLFCDIHGVNKNAFQVEFQRQLQAGQTPQDPLHDDGRDCCCCRSLDADNDADEAPCSPRVSRGLALAIVLGYTLLDTVNCLLLSSGFIGAARGLSVEADGTIAPERTGAHGALTAVGVILGLGAGVRVLASLSIGVYLRVRDFNEAFWGSGRGMELGEGH